MCGRVAGFRRPARARESGSTKLVAVAKNDPAFLAEQATVKAAYRSDFIEKAVARGEPREEVEKSFDEMTREKALCNWRTDLA